MFSFDNDFKILHESCTKAIILQKRYFIKNKVRYFIKNSLTLKVIFPYSTLKI